MKKLDKSSELSLGLGRTKIAKLNSTYMIQIEGGNKSNAPTRGIPSSSWTCLTSIVPSSKLCG
ncbi:hypothetical protein [uncultured Dokdonia sp.]|uniref:hypothetical protein n=1 Tax=uncultured Dokdonia sp. TaxID=575653 RepID=UPI00260E14A1|nr:hypothetical protein [uncultured Dokdonia sp.]